MTKAAFREGAQSKIKSLGAVVKIAAQARLRGKRIVTTNGCFDILHVGHVATLEWAKRHGDILIVGVDSDASVRANKGSKRPLMPAIGRAQVLAGLSAVDYVFIFNDKNPIPWIKKIAPAIHVKGKGSEKDPRLPPEIEAVKAGGGRVMLAPKIKGRSTTDIIETILRRYKLND